MLKVSILVPIYNVESYLAACLESLIHQTLQEIEIICINDGSTDLSPVIAAKYARKDSRIHLINKENTGYGNTMNVGLRIAKGEYIGFVESDDYASPEMFEVLYQKAKKYEAEVVKSNFFEHRGDSETSGVQNEFVELLSGFPYSRLLTKEEQVGLHMVHAQIWSAIYKRSFIEQYGIGFNETPGASYQDTSFAFQVWFYAKRVVLEQGAYLHYRVDNPGSSIHSQVKLFCFCDEYTYIEEFLHNNPHDKEKEYIVQAIKFRDYFWTYFRVAGRYQYAFLLRMKEEADKAFALKLLKQEYFHCFPHIWNQLQSILEHMEDFYEETAKCLDERIEELSCNSTVYCQGVIDELKNADRVIVYGAGKIGLKVLKALNNLGIENISAVVVTDMTGNPEQLLGISVRSISSLEENDRQMPVIVAVGRSHQLEIIIYLKKHNFTKVLALDRSLREFLLSD